MMRSIKELMAKNREYITKDGNIVFPARQLQSEFARRLLLQRVGRGFICWLWEMWAARCFWD